MAPTRSLERLALIPERMCLLVEHNKGSVPKKPHRFSVGFVIKQIFDSIGLNKPLVGYNNPGIVHLASTNLSCPAISPFTY